MAFISKVVAVRENFVASNSGRLEILLEYYGGKNCELSFPAQQPSGIYLGEQEGSCVSPPLVHCQANTTGRKQGREE